MGDWLTRTAVAEWLALAVRTTARTYPEFAKLRITPHVVRHSLAIHLLQAGVDITVITLWLGHESLATTHVYVEADPDESPGAAAAAGAAQRGSSEGY